MTKQLLIKVCGMRRPDNIRAVSQLPIDYMGFIFCKSSKRYVDMLPSGAGFIPDFADESIANIGPNADAPTHAAHNINKVGVFVDSTIQDIITRVVGFHLNTVQLHGHESPTFIRNMRLTLIPDIQPHLQVFKAFNISSAADFDRCKEYEGIVDMFVFDAKCNCHGGSGKQFDWSLLDAYKGTTPFLLSGGIGENDLDRITQLHHPQYAGVDLNSRFETAPAVKDVEKLAHFIKQLRTRQKNTTI